MVWRSDTRPRNSDLIVALYWLLYRAIRFADAYCVSDVEVVLVALRSAKVRHCLHWSPLAHATVEVRDNREVVICAVTAIGISL